MNVLITGGSRGIGRACVELFCKNNYNVYFFYKNSDVKAKEVEKKTGARAIKCDITSYNDVLSAFEKIGCDIDIIVNNAGISQIKMFQDISENDWDNMFNTNVKGIFNVTKTFMMSMIKKKKGRIINISSMWGEEGASCEVHYSASKAAVIGFTKALAKELAPSGITVNCVSPGVIDTDMNSNITEQDKEDLCSEIPMGYIGTAEDVANTVLFLAKDEAKYITGAVVPVNGGLVM